MSSYRDLKLVEDLRPEENRIPHCTVGADADVGICSNEGRTLGSKGRPCGLGQVIAAALSAVKTKLVFARNREFEGR